jgi:Lar family restriction alleviation protein
LDNFFINKKERCMVSKNKKTRSAKTTKKPQPNPCPACGSKDVGVEMLNPFENDRAVVCDDCNYTGPIARQHSLAIEAWNNAKS